MSDSKPQPTLSVIVPVHNGAHFLASSLAPLHAALGDALLELWVVDDASTDGSGELAKEFGAQVLRTSKRSGPAAARNLGAERAAGDVLVFIDADVVIHPEMLERIRQAMSDPSRTALFGCYDDLPPETNFASLYMNLRHHMMHQRNAGRTTNFWSGFGAVRRGAFLDAGGFDAKRFAEPSVEDIEFGNRLSRIGGRILLDPELLCTHLKRWRMGEVIRTDCLFRALPWSRLLVQTGSRGVGLNVSRGERGRAAIAIAALVASTLSLTGLLSWWSTVPLIAATFLLTRGLVRLLFRRGGWDAAVYGVLYHQLYYLYCSAIYGGCWTSALPQRFRRYRGLRV